MQWYDFTGLSKQESLGEGFHTVIHPDDLPVFLDKWRHHSKNLSECHAEVRYRRKDGVYRWGKASACPLLDESGKLLKWYGTTTDIHDLVIQRVEARYKKKQILTVLAHAEVNLFAVDKNRIITMAEGGMQWDSSSNTYDVENKSSLIGKDAITISRSTQPGGVPGMWSFSLP